MKKNFLFSILFATEIFFGNISFAQTNTFPSSGSAGIGTTTPNAASLLEVKSTTQGVLIPRMTKAQRDAITSPPQGLLTYVTDKSPGLYYYEGSWKSLSKGGANTTLSNLVSSTAVNVDLLPATNNSINFGSSLLGWKNIYTAGCYYVGSSKVVDVSGIGNTFLGATGNTTNSGSENVFVGTGTGASNTSGYNNTAIGNNVLQNNSSGYQNTGMGHWALQNNSTGIFNAAFGSGALSLNTSGSFNSALGTSALDANTTGYNNAACGYASLAANTTGYENAANGFYSLGFNTEGYDNSATGMEALFRNTTGFYNVANGARALYSNTTGIENTANGYQAMYSNTTGSDNTANGISALYSNTEGNLNNATGQLALYFNTTGWYNNAYGAQSLFSNTTGQLNDAFGQSSMQNNTTGSNNVANGFFSLLNNTTGGNNTGIGYRADANSSGYNNSIALGNYSLITADNQVRIGNGSVTSIGGFVDWSNLSDGRFKKNIQENVKGLEFINKLQPITYTLDIHGVNTFLRKDMPEAKTADGKIIEAPKQDESAMAAKEKIVYSGFIAQDVEKSAKEVGYDFSGVDAPKNDKDIYGLRYAEFVVPLVKAVQELSDQNEKLSSGLLAEKMKNEELENRLSKIEMLTGVNDQGNLLENENQKVILEGTTLYALGQNIPNPFMSSTLIPYSLPENISSASLMIQNEQGIILKNIELKAGGGSVEIETRDLASGTYQYSLIIDGKTVSSKQMILTK